MPTSDIPVYKELTIGDYVGAMAQDRVHYTTVLIQRMTGLTLNEVQDAAHDQVCEWIEELVRQTQAVTPDIPNLKLTHWDGREWSVEISDPAVVDVKRYHGELYEVATIRTALNLNLTETYDLPIGVVWATLRPRTEEPSNALG